MTVGLGEVVFISYHQQCTLPVYVERYLRTRRIAANDETRERVLSCIDRYRGPLPLTKANLDFYLDANLGRAG